MLHDVGLAWTAAALLALWLYQGHRAKEWWRKSAEEKQEQLQTVKAHYAAEAERLNMARENFVATYARKNHGLAPLSNEDLTSFAFPMDILEAHEQQAADVFAELDAMGISGWYIRHPESW